MSDDAALHESAVGSEVEGEYVETAAGELPVDWDIKNVDDLCALNNGKATNHTEIGEQQFPVYGSNGPIGSHSESNFDGGLIFGRVGAVGEIERVREPVWVSDNAIKAGVTDYCNTDFLFYYLSNKELNSLATKTAQPLLNQSTIGNVTVPSPPLPEQRKIATVLDTVDQAIQKSKEIIDQMNRMKMGVLEKLFTPQTKRNKLIKHRLGSITRHFPQDWEAERFGTFADLEHGHQFRSDDYCENGSIPVLKIGQMTKSGIDLSDTDQIPENDFDEYSSFTIEESSALIALSGATLGKTAFFESHPGPVLQNYRVGKISLKNDRVQDKYIYYAMGSSLFRKQLIGRVGKQAQGNIGKSDFERIKVPLPPRQEQNEIVEIMSSIDQQIGQERVIREQMNGFRLGLQQDLLSGEVRTTDTKIQLPDEITQYG